MYKSPFHLWITLLAKPKLTLVSSLPWSERVDVYLDRARVVLSILESIAKHLSAAVSEVRVTLKPSPSE